MSTTQILVLSAIVVGTSSIRALVRLSERQRRRRVLADRNCLSIDELYELSGASTKVAIIPWKEAWSFVAGLLHVDSSRLRPTDTILSLHFPKLGFATDMGRLNDEVIANGKNNEELVTTIGEAVLVIARRIEIEKVQP